MSITISCGEDSTFTVVTACSAEMAKGAPPCPLPPMKKPGSTEFSAVEAGLAMTPEPVLRIALIPPPPPDPNAPKPKINRILVDDDGHVFLNEEGVADTALLATLRGLKATDPDPKVVVKGGDNVDYQSMIKVLDALQQLDITKVGLATQ